APGTGPGTRGGAAARVGSDELGAPRAQDALLACGEDRRQAVRNAFDAFQVRVAQAAVVVDVDRAIAVELLHQQADRGLAVLRGLDRILEYGLVVGLVVHRDDGAAGAQARI